MKLTIQPTTFKWFKNDWVFALFVIVTLFSVALKFYFLPKLYIIEDEAYYWFWAKHLSWGYPEHPPMIAWLIAPFRWALGASPYAIRLPGMLMFLIISPIVYIWAKDLAKAVTVAVTIKHNDFDSNDSSKFNLNPHQTGIVAALLVQTIPFYIGSSLINLPDTPQIFFIFLTSLLYYLGFFVYRKFLILGGVSLGLAMLSKLTAAHLAIAIVLFILISPRRIDYLKSPLLWISFILSAVVFSPFVIWNWQEGFPVLYNLNRHLARSTNFNKIISFWTEQSVFYLPIALTFLLGVLLPEPRKFIFSKIFSSFKHLKSEAYQKYLFTLLVSLVPVLYFIYKSFTLPIRVNWLSGAFIGFSVLSGILVAKYWRQFRYFVLSCTILITLLIGFLFSFLVNSTSGEENLSARLLKQFYPSYNYYLKSYLEYYYFDQHFKKLYDEVIHPINLERKKNQLAPLPIVTHSYQTASIINYYVEPEVEAFGWADQENYVQLIYFHSDKTPYYRKQLTESYFLINHDDNPNLATFGFNEDSQKITFLTKFDTYPKNETSSKDYFLYLIEKK